ncbi:type II toxin-antitoxin system VapB family antitoxin [Brevundimonas vesicularis]|uniref:type II toxin-antitoxin system VapB family antitoxin n=1 Tax=Brevundimonas vesicularis TaxID=41276 RepID=UPI0022AC8E6E|nr:type II toxin-antitoxin system VapB family antitoxin [Brevundimonas vesicularis]
MGYVIDISARSADMFSMSGALKATVFKSNRSQAVRLPKAVAFPDDVKELRVIKEGKGLLLLPANAVWDDFFDKPGIDIEEPADPVDDTVISFD